jgi:hypothetical protein
MSATEQFQRLLSNLGGGHVPAILIDLDGVIIDNSHRLHHPGIFCCIHVIPIPHETSKVGSPIVLFNQPFDNGCNMHTHFSPFQNSALTRQLTGLLRSRLSQALDFKRMLSIEPSFPSISNLNTAVVVNVGQPQRHKQAPLNPR